MNFSLRRLSGRANSLTRAFATGDVGGKMTIERVSIVITCIFGSRWTRANDFSRIFIWTSTRETAIRATRESIARGGDTLIPHSYSSARANWVASCQACGKPLRDIPHKIRQGPWGRFLSIPVMGPAVASTDFSKSPAARDNRTLLSWISAPN